MYILNSNFSLRKEIGNLHILKFSELKSYFENKFPEIIRPEENILIFKKGSEAIVISPEQITYTFSGEDSELNITDISEYLNEINNILELTKSGITLFRLEGTESVEVNTLEKSKDAMKNSFNEIDPQGIGFRFIVNNNNFQGNVHIEPFINNPNKIYYNIILDSKETSNIQDLVSNFNSLYSYCTTNVSRSAKSLFSI